MNAIKSILDWVVLNACVGLLIVMVVVGLLDPRPQKRNKR